MFPPMLREELWKDAREEFVRCHTGDRNATMSREQRGQLSIVCGRSSGFPLTHGLQTASDKVKIKENRPQPRLRTVPCPSTRFTP